MAFNTFGATICPQNCTAITNFPDLDTNQNCIEASTVGILSQVSDLYFRFSSATTAPATFSTSDMLTYLTAEVDNSNTDDTKVKWLVVEGGVGDPEETITELPKNQEKVTKRTYTLTATLRNLSDKNREYLRRMQCGSTDFTFWYATVGENMFGNVDGISPNKVTARLPLGESRTDVETGVIEIQWESDIDAERITDPIA